MKFSFPILTLCHGGAQRMLVEMTNGLSERGHDVTIVMPPQGIVDYEIKGKLIRTASQELGENDIPASDAIISNYYLTVAASQRASNQGKGIHIRLSLCYEPAFLPHNHISFSSYKETKNLLVLSKWQRELIFLLHGIKGHIVPIGVSPDFKNFNIRKELQRPLNLTAILRKPEGGYSSHREQEHLLYHLDLVKQWYPSVEVNFVSPPSEFHSSLYLQKLNETGKYRFYLPANDNELCHIYNLTDIFISSTSYDAGSLPGLEAMKCGAAVVTLYSGGNMEYGVHGRNCLMSYLYENRLSADIVQLIQNPDLRDRLAHNGENDSRSYTWENSLSAFEKGVYKMIHNSTRS